MPGREVRQAGGFAHVPLIKALWPLGYKALPTAEQGGCGIYVTAFWDGRDRTEATRKALRIELPSGLEACAEDPSVVLTPMFV